MLHSFHRYFRSMDRTLHPWMEYLFMEVGTSSWSSSTHLMGKDPSMGCTISMDVSKLHGYVEYSWNFNGFATTSSTLFTTSPTPPAATALIIIHHIIALASDSLTCFITSLSLDLLGLNLIFVRWPRWVLIVIVEIFEQSEVLS